MSWLTYFALIAGIWTIVYAFRGKTIAQYPSQRGMFIGTGIALLATGGWTLVHPTSTAWNSETLFIVGSILLAALMFGLISSYPFVKKKAGPLLLDAIPRAQSRRISGLTTAGVFAVLAIFAIVRGQFTREATAELIFYISVIIYFASPVFGKVELRQYGILDAYTLIRWSDISSYRWAGEHENNLIVSLKTPWRRNATIILPPGHKESLEPFFKRQLSPNEPQG
jgi:hypothetical protein